MSPSLRNLARGDGETSPPRIQRHHFGPRLTWALPLCSSPLADMGAEVHYSPGVLLVNSSSVTATFDGTVSVSISASAGLLSVVCSLPDRYHNTTKGLLGEGTNGWATAASFLLQQGRRARAQGPLPTPRRVEEAVGAWFWVSPGSTGEGTPILRWCPHRCVGQQPRR